MRLTVLGLTTVALAGCGGESETNGSPPPATSCDARALPLDGVESAPSLTALYLDCTADAVELLAVIGDSQGDADLRNVPQVLRVHRSTDCGAGTIEISDDVAASHEVEAFGIVFEEQDLPDLYATICTGERWPVDAELRDATENVTTGRVWATVLDDEP